MVVKIQAKQSALGALTKKEQTFLEVYLQTGRKGGAARKAGIGPQRVSELLRRPHIRRAIERANDEALGGMVHRLLQSLERALDGLDELRDSGPPPVRADLIKFHIGQALKLATAERGRKAANEGNHGMSEGERAFQEHVATDARAREAVGELLATVGAEQAER